MPPEMPLAPTDRQAEAHPAWGECSRSTAPPMAAPADRPPVLPRTLAEVESSCATVVLSLLPRPSIAALQRGKKLRVPAPPPRDSLLRSRRSTCPTHVHHGHHAHISVICALMCGLVIVSLFAFNVLMLVCLVSAAVLCQSRLLKKQHLVSPLIPNTTSEGCVKLPLMPLGHCAVCLELM